MYNHINKPENFTRILYSYMIHKKEIPQSVNVQ